MRERGLEARPGAQHAQADARPATQDLLERGSYVSIAAIVTAIAAMYAGVILTYSSFLDAGPGTMIAAFACFAASALAVIAGLLIWLRSGWAKAAAGLVALLTGAAFAGSTIMLLYWAVAQGKNPIVIMGPIATSFGLAVLTLVLAARFPRPTRALE